jgi:hypothetical protein
MKGPGQRQLMIVCMSIASFFRWVCAVAVSNKTMGYRDEMINIDNITLSITLSKFKMNVSQA